MTLSAPPSVEDPVQFDMDDLVIKEAKRRARRRRWGYGGIGAAVAVVLGVAAACGPRYAASTHLSITPAPASSSLATSQFLSLPPDAGGPSTPTTGELVAVIPTEHTRVWVYGDGRLITMHMFPFTTNTWPNSGFVMQRLTPAGVEMIRSYVADNIGARNLIPVEETYPEVARAMRVLVDGKMYRSANSGGAPYWWRCPWGGCEPYVSSLDTRLPASAWADKEYQRYVPSKYLICYGGQPESWASSTLRTGGDVIQAATFRSALPVEARDLLAAAPTIPPEGPDPGQEHADSDATGTCAMVSLADARRINESLVAAGFGPALADVAPTYLFTIPTTAESAGQGEITGRIAFRTVLPHGEADGNGA